MITIVRRVVIALQDLTMAAKLTLGVIFVSLTLVASQQQTEQSTYKYVTLPHILSSE